MAPGAGGLWNGLRGADAKGLTGSEAAASSKSCRKRDFLGETTPARLAAPPCRCAWKVGCDTKGDGSSSELHFKLPYTAQLLSLHAMLGTNNKYAGSTLPALLCDQHARSATILAHP